MLQKDINILLLTNEVSDYVRQSEEHIVGFKPPRIVQGSVLTIYFCTTQLQRIFKNISIGQQMNYCFRSSWP